MTDPTRIVLWLVGEPGSGKTSLARGLLGPTALLTLTDKPKWTRGAGVVAAGHYTGSAFDGADTVPYNGAADALTFWREVLTTAPLTVLDGDRFSNENSVKFFRDLVTGGAALRLVCAYVDVPAAVAAARRTARSETVQNASWVAGRATKARRFYEGFYDSVRINGESPLADQMGTLDAHLKAPAPAPPADNGGILGLL